MPSTFSVFYDGQFWVGVLEITDSSGVRAARHIFGGEPSNAELEEFAVRRYGRLLDRALAAPVATTETRRATARINPKRLARLAAREQAARPVSSLAQDALRAAHEQAGHENRAAAKRRRSDEQQHRRTTAARKRKEKHRGH